MTARRPYSRHGLNAIKARVKIRGLHAIDQRTAAAQALVTWRQELVADMGGEAALSAQQRALVEINVRRRLYLEHVDAWLLEQASLVNGRRRTVLSVLRDREELARAFTQDMERLGLEKRAPAPPTLAERLEARRSGSAPSGAPLATSDPSLEAIASPARNVCRGDAGGPRWQEPR